MNLWTFAEEEARKQGLPPGLVRRVMRQESGGRVNAVSSKGARGPMQLMPGTAKDLGVMIDDPLDNIRGGVRYLARQYKDFGTPELALAAYNAGPGAVRKYGGIPPYRETQNYVRAIVGAERMKPGRQGQDGSDIFGFSGAAPGQGSDAADGSDIFADAPSKPQPSPKTAALLPRPAAPAASKPRSWQDEVTGFMANLNRGLLIGDELQGSMNAGRDVIAGRSKVNPIALGKALLYATPSVAGALGQNPATALSAFKESGVPAAFAKGMEKERGIEDEFSSRRPYTAAGARLAGNLATAVVPAGAAGNAVSGGGAATTAARGAISAAVPGYAAGFADRGNLRERTGAGALGATVAAPLGAGAALLASRGVRAPTPSRDAQTAIARQELETMGLDMDALPMDAQDDIRNMIAAGRSPREAAVAAAARSLPEPVPMTRGQLSLDPVQQLDENIMLRGGEGARPAEIMRGQRALQQEALRGNVSAITQEMGGGVPAARGEAGAAASGRLNEMRDAANDAVNQAFTVARREGEGVILPRDQTPVLASRLRDAVRDYDMQRVPSVGRAIERLDDLGGATQVRDLFEMRSNLSTLRRSGDQVEASAARTASRELDRFLDEAVTADLFSGDSQAVGLWRDAIRQRREFGDLFQSDDLIAKLTERTYRGGEPTLAVDPRDASNYIFGRAEMGVAGRKNLTRDLERLREVLGDESPQWNAIRSEAFQRISRSAEGATEGGSRQFSGVNFSKAWAKFNQTDPDLAAALFSREERGQIDQLASVAARATSPVRGGDNSSNTAVTAKRLVSRFARNLPFAREIIDALDQQRAIGNAIEATNGAVPAARPGRLRGQVSPQTYRLIGVASGSKKEPR